MTRLTDALEQLADRTPGRGSDQVLAAARERAAHLRRRRLIAMGGLAAAAAIVVVAASSWAFDDDRDHVDSGLAATTEGGTVPTPTTASDLEPSSTVPGPTTTSGAPPSTSDTTPPVAGSTVDVHLLTGDGSDCTATQAVPRPADGPAVLRTALDHLLRGPTAAERADGLHSSFSEATAGGVRSVSLVQGVALVDLDRDVADAIPNASTACGASALLAQLDATTLQFEGVERAVYSYDGDVAAFYDVFGGVAPDGSSTTPEADGVPPWPGSVGHDPSGTLDLGGFPAHLAQVDPDGRLGVGAITSLLLHLEDERARGTLVLVEHLDASTGRSVAVTLSNLGDDSIAEVRYEIRVRVDGPRPVVVAGTWTQRCHPGRGHQEPSAEDCV